jgi:hypothetical protein
MEHNKASGLDNFLAKFYQNFWKLIKTKHNKASGLDNFLAKFCQNFWKLIKTNLLEFFSSLYCGLLELFCLDFGDFFT